ncbi:hypothetical protein C1N61_32545 (plasmid) [Priestia aryabhattai]
MNTYLEQIKRYENDILDLDISPFETTHTLHQRSKLEEEFCKMNTPEQIKLLSVDLKVIKNAQQVSEHLAPIYNSVESHRPISQWWWHLDKIANGQLSLKGINVFIK